MAEVNTLAKKLQIREGSRVVLLNAPEGASAQLAPLPTNARLVDGRGGGDVIVCYVQDQVALGRWATQALTLAESGAVLWFVYPKKSSKLKTDITRDVGWEPVTSAGYEGVSILSIDDTWSALRFRATKTPTFEARINAQYAGAKAALRPILEKIQGIVTGFGPDVTVQPRQSYVAFARGRQFALVKPSRDKVELGLKFNDAPIHARLEPAVGIGSGSMTHRVVLTTTADVDEVVAAWLAYAYAAAE